MSKDFEQAYRELAESEIPDLWDRIEAGLENKPTPEKEENCISAQENPSEATASSYKKPQQEKTRLFSKRYWGIVAAAVCVLMIVPAAVVIFGIGSGRLRYGGSGAADTTEGIDLASAPQEEGMELAAEESCDTTAEESCDVTEEDFDEATKESSDDVADEQSGVAEEMDTGGMAGASDRTAELSEAEESEMAEDADDLMRESQTIDAGAGSAQKKQSDNLESAKLESAAEDTAEESGDISSMEPVEGTVFEQVVIEVLKVEDDFDREDGSIPGTLYTVMVQKDASGQLTEGEELVIDIPAYSSIALPRGEIFEVDLVYKGNGIYELERYDRQTAE